MDAKQNGMFDDEITKLGELAVNMQVKYVDDDEVYELAKALEQACDQVGDTELLENEVFELQEEVSSLMSRISKMEEFLKKHSLLEEYLKPDDIFDDLADLDALLRADSRYGKSLQLKVGEFTPR